MADDENSLTGRLLRYANVGTGVGGAITRNSARQPASTQTLRAS